MFRQTTLMYGGP